MKRLSLSAALALLAGPALAHGGHAPLPEAAHGALHMGIAAAVLAAGFAATGLHRWLAARSGSRPAAGGRDG